VTIGGAPAAGVAELTTAHGKGRVAAGSFSFVVRTIGADCYLLAQDADNPAARNFTGTEWFPVDHAYRVRAEFVAYAQPQSVTVPMTHIEAPRRVPLSCLARNPREASPFLPAALL
jgi:uncharacterized protein (DUF1684 family)